MGVWCLSRHVRPARATALLVGLLLIAGTLIGLFVHDPAGGSSAGPTALQEDAFPAPTTPISDAPFSNVMAALDAGHNGPPGQAVARALRAIADAHQVPVPQADECPTLADAVTMHTDRLGMDAPTIPLPVMPGELDEALACLLYAVHQSNLAMDRTFEGLSQTQIMSLYEAAKERRPMSAALLALLEDRDHAHNLVAAIQAAEAVDRAAGLIEGLKASGAPLPPIDLEPVVRFSPEGDDRYEDNYALIVDLEGNDVYDNHAGGVFIAMGSAIWEVEEGSESFGTNVAGQNIVVGGNVQDAETVVSSSMVLDLDGDDTYGVRHPPMLKDLERGCTEEEIVPMVGTAGGGVIGTGMLFDLAGDDTFIGRTGTQGSGHILGVGVLYSGGGHDTFEAIRLAQGSGLLGGIGLLINDGGDNAYTAQPPAGGVWNGDLLICDEDSRYVQGSAFDRRVGPALPSVGILADLDGDTSYSGWSKAHGFGQGPGLGLLYEATGDDTYQAIERSQGSAQGRNKDTHPQAPWGSGYAVLFDREGNDSYALTGGPLGYRGQGYSLGHAHEQPFPEPTDPNAVIQWAVDRNEAIGLLFDGSGEDAFQGPPGRADDTLHTDGILGLFYASSPEPT